MSTTPTTIAVRVIARDGKFLGDDIGGAHITVRDALTKQILTEGATSGGSGLNGAGGVMCIPLRRGEPLPTTGASEFLAVLNLDKPRRIEVTAYGPLGAPQSANTASATQWVYPGRDIIAGNGFLLELPGLITQILFPPTHYMPTTPVDKLEIRANVAMMCGCPISIKPDGAICPGAAGDQPWLPDEFDVVAMIRPVSSAAVEVRLRYVQADTPGQFHGVWQSPLAGVSEITVYAFQRSTGNTGVDVATVVLPKP